MSERRGGRALAHALPNDASAPGRARQACEEALRSWWGDEVGDLDLDAVLVVSELVTNAVEAHAGSIALQLDAVDGHLRIAVRDDAARMPEPSDPGSFGRGLTIVERLSSDWGVDAGTAAARDGARDGGHDGGRDGVAPTRSKTVWATLALPAGLAD